MKSYRISAKLASDGVVSSDPVIKRFGNSVDGIIERNFLVLGEMPLWALHYALAKAFGFQNEHLHRFELPEEVFNKLTGCNVSKWRELVGVYFKSPCRDENEDFWPDDYESGSFNKWRRKKYSAPYTYGGLYPTKEDWKETLDEFINENDDGFVCFPRTLLGRSYKEVMPKRYYNGKIDQEILFSFDALPLESLPRLFEYGTSDLIETLTIDGLFNDSFKELLYYYDYGDGWEITVSISDGVSKEEEQKVLEAQHPLMISYKGLNLVEDVGGPGGYDDMLITLFNLKEADDEADSEDGKATIECEDKLYFFIDDDIRYRSNRIFLSPANLLSWAQDLGWKKTLPKLDKWF